MRDILSSEVVVRAMKGPVRYGVRAPKGLGITSSRSLATFTVNMSRVWRSHRVRKHTRKRVINVHVVRHVYGRRDIIVRVK